jgi:signal transduction histidine kinase
MSPPASGLTSLDSSPGAAELRAKKRVLAALVVHDLRSPIAAIEGYLQLLREEIVGGGAPAQQLAYLDDASTLVGKALSLVATILDVDELEDGILRANLTEVGVLELVERARAQVGPGVEVRELAVEIDVAPSLVVALDRDLFARVFENLLDNAVRYAPRQGRLVIAARVEAGVFELAVGNSGPPVPVDERATIFGRYFQVEARRAAARANRGLGLYFCKLAVEAHGGTIHVEQRGSLGAVFVVRIPRAPIA